MNDIASAVETKNGSDQIRTTTTLKSSHRIMLEIFQHYFSISCNGLTLFYHKQICAIFIFIYDRYAFNDGFMAYVGCI